MAMILNIEAQPLTIDKFPYESGILFEKLGNVQLTNMDWKILIYFDLRNLKSELKSFKAYMNEIQNACISITKLDPHCQNVIVQIKNNINQFDENQEKIFRLTPRHKRGLLNGIGKIAKYVFGTLDEDDAEYYNNQILTLENNDNHLLNLIKNQTTIVDSTVKIIRSTKEETSNQFAILGSKLNSLTNQVDKISGELSKNIIATRLNTIVLSTIMIMNKFSKTQEIILGLLNDIKHGRPDSLIISNKDLNHQLGIIRQNLPANLILPFQQQGTDLTETLKIIKIDTTIHEEKLLVRLSIPLLSRETFSVFRIIPVPTLHAGHYVFIRPNMEYIAITPTKDNYYPLTQQELSSCVNTNLQNFICDQIHPIFSTNHENKICEIELLSHATSIPKDCPMKVTDPYRFYIRLTNPNSWIYVLDKPYTVDLICGTETKTYDLNGSGIFKILPGCSFRNQEIRIDARDTLTTLINESYSPPFNLSTSDIQIPNSTKIHDQTKSVLVKTSNSAELDNISRSIEDLKEKQKFPKNISQYHNVHHYILIYILFTLIIVSLLGYFYQHGLIKFKITQKANVSTPNEGQ